MAPKYSLTCILAFAITVVGCARPAVHSSDVAGGRVAVIAVPDGIARSAIVGRFDVGGHSLFLECAGTGSPNIVFLHGIGGERMHGAYLLQALSNRVRVCTYDRPNQGASDPVAGRQTAAIAVNDLHRLLAAGGVRPPYLLVAGSFGGLIGISYAGAYPSEVVGMVMLDAALPSDAEIDQILPEPDRTDVTREHAVGHERFEYSTLAEAGAALDKMPQIPVTYLGATRFADVPSGWPADRIHALTRQHWREFVARFPDGRLVEVDASHSLRHDVVITEVNRMLALLSDASGTK